MSSFVIRFATPLGTPGSSCRGTGLRIGVAALAVATAAGIMTFASAPARATGGPAVSPTTTVRVVPNAATTLSGLSVSGDTVDTLQATVATTVGTISISTTTNLTLAYNNHWTGDTSITFTGLQSDIDTALATAQLVTTSGNAGSTASVSLSAMVSQPGYVYSAPNGHFYQYVHAQGTTWTADNAAAQSLSFDGQQGYLATMPNDTVNNFVTNKIQGALNVWFGAKSVDTPGSTYARTWQWVGGPLAGQPISYCTNFTGTCSFSNNTGLYSHWAPVEPNNYGATTNVAYSGEYVAVTNWQGGVGLWNDLAPNWTGLSAIAGYVVEYGNQVNGSTGFTGVVNTSSNVLIAGPPAAATNVVGTRGDGSVSVSFTAPATNGSAITGYTVTTSPGGATTSCMASPCTITGLTNGNSYTFTVTATNTYGTGAASSSSASVVPAGVPAAPTNLTATRGNGSATLQFTPPSGNGANILSYQYSVDGVNWSTMPTSSAGSNLSATITGLVNGTQYNIQVRAVNGVGPGAAAGPASATPARAPDAPTSVTAARAGQGAVLVSWSPPVVTGGNAIMSYTITASGGGGTLVCSASPCTMSGLTDGTSYTFTVHATNGVGDSPESAASSAVTPAIAPSPPTNLGATSGNGSATVTFTAPVDDGGSPVQNYTVTSSPGSVSATCSASPCTVSGLTNGTSYTFTVHATNNVGDSIDAGPTGAVTPATTPGAPSISTVVGGDSSAVLTFSAPVADGGSSILGYTVTGSPGGATTSCSASPCTVTGLTNGTSYTFTVQAVNGAGPGATSATSGSVTPAGVPQAPTNLTVTRGDAQATLDFTPPTDNGSTIIRYEYSTDGSTWVVLTTSPNGSNLTGTVTGLTNGSTYDFLVRAVNGVGPGGGAGPASGTPARVPDAPTSVAATAGGADGTVQVSWSAPLDNGGDAITSYTVTSAPDGVTVMCDASPCVVANLTDGTGYTFTVHATNGVGGSVESASSNSATPAPPATTPGQPLSVQVTSANGALHIRFLPPSQDGGSAITGYEASTDNGGTWVALTTSGSSPITATVTGLTNGTAYSVQVRAVNVVGSGPADTGSATGTPATVPDPPRSVVATVSGTSVVVTWHRPVSDGGSPITGYTVVAHPGGAQCHTSGLTCTLTGLVPGRHYTVLVRAINTVVGMPNTGVGAAGTSGSTMFAGEPTAPRNLRVYPGDRVMNLQFEPPTSDGGSPITAYQVSLDGGQSWRAVLTAGAGRGSVLTRSVRGVRAAGASSVLTASVYGVLDGRNYHVQLRAVNGNGPGAATGVVKVATTSWFHDPIGATSRSHERKVPAHPARYHGKLLWTTARDRAHDGAPAMPVASLHGHQLQPGQAASLGMNALFAFDSARLNRAGRATVRSLVHSLRYDKSVVCEGYTDYGGRTAHEESLSLRRAQAVCWALKHYGARVRLRTHGYGAADPVIIGGRPTQRAANRRVIVFVTG